LSAGAYSHGLLGSGETIALYELEPYATSDVSTFESCYGVTTTVNEIKVDGGVGSGPGYGESILDIENVIELAPQSDGRRLRSA
jgi:kumamolisin